MVVCFYRWRCCVVGMALVRPSMARARGGGGPWAFVMRLTSCVGCPGSRGAE